jgi:hypothetical protein
MLRPSQISEQIAKMADNHLSVEEFERWFRIASRNFHAYQDEAARAAIFEIENVLSEYHEDLDEEATQRELAAAIFPFEDHPAVQFGFASNSYGSPIDVPISGNNNVGFNQARVAA